MLTKFMTWVREWRHCLRLARQIHRGELIGVRPGLLSATLAYSAGPAPVSSVEVALEPEAASGVSEVEADTGKQWHIRLVKEDGIPKVVDSDADVRAAMRRWNTFPKRKASFVLELYDSYTDVVRGTR